MDVQYWYQGLFISATVQHSQTWSWTMQKYAAGMSWRADETAKRGVFSKTIRLFTLTVDILQGVRCQFHRWSYASVLLEGCQVRGNHFSTGGQDQKIACST